MADHDTHDHTGVTGIPDLAAHTGDTSDAHDASAISFDPSGLSNTSATDVQTALEDLDGAISGASGSVATDAIFDAKGDLAVGTGSNTSAKLTVGGDGSILIADAGESTGLRYVSHPELDDFNVSGASNIDFTSPTSDNAALTFLTDQEGIAKVIQSTEVTTRRHAYVASAIGTGNFDIRMRVISFDITSPHTAASVPFMALFAADSSLTTTTRLSVQVGNTQGAAADLARVQCIAVDGTGGVGTAIFGHKLPIVMRMTRSGTTITRYVSSNEGRTWSQLGATTTSSLNIARIGLIVMGGSTGTQTSVALVHWFRSF